jgi:hypothetical protein
MSDVDDRIEVKEEGSSRATLLQEKLKDSTHNLDSEDPSPLPSGATTPALPDLTFPARVQEAIQLKSPPRLNKDTPASSSDAVIIGIAVVDFNHLVGPQVEYAHPKELLEDEELCGNLPFLALPDGSHLVSLSNKRNARVIMLTTSQFHSLMKTFATFI